MLTDKDELSGYNNHIFIFRWIRKNEKKTHFYGGLRLHTFVAIVFLSYDYCS